VEEKDKVEEPKKLLDDEAALLNFAAFPGQLKTQDKTKSDIELDRKREE
jgi:hypothetical protein